MCLCLIMAVKFLSTLVFAFSPLSVLSTNILMVYYTMA